MTGTDFAHNVKHIELGNVQVIRADLHRSAPVLGFDMAIPARNYGPLIVKPPKKSANVVSSVITSSSSTLNKAGGAPVVNPLQPVADLLGVGGVFGANPPPSPVTVRRDFSSRAASLRSGFGPNTQNALNASEKARQAAIMRRLTVGVGANNIPLVSARRKPIRLGADNVMAN